MKNLKIAVVLLILLLTVLFVFMQNEKKSSVAKKPIVSVTTFALYDVTKHIAGNTMKVVNILPFGVDPHDFEPTPKLMRSVSKSALFIYSGAGLEPWIHGFRFKGKAIDMSKYVKLRKLQTDAIKNDSEHLHQAIDPHYWLDFDNMKIAAKVITQELIALQPKDKALYIKNRDKYIHMLEKLDEAYKHKLSDCKEESVVISHNALGYVANRYGFHVKSLTGLALEAEPSAQSIKEIFQDIHKQGIKTIFYEVFANAKLIKSIAKDANISAETFQPLGNITADEARKKLTYEDIMKENLNKLSKALMCK